MTRRRVLAAVLVSCLSAFGEKVELAWTAASGEVERETVDLVVTDEVFTLTIPKERIRARQARHLRVTPEFARARKGETGYWYSPYGYYGEWDRSDGRFEAEGERMNMPMYGWSTPRGSYLAVIESLRLYPYMSVTAKAGDYAVACELGAELCARPYEDFRIVFRRFPADATYADLAHAYRNVQLERRVVRPLAERVRDNPVLKQAVEAPEIRIRQAWKPVPSPVAHQCPENEPDVRAVVTFDRVRDIVRELQRQGVDNAELCLVGWNVGGHDGRWPECFPAEPKLGGTRGLQEAIRCAREAGYLIVPHGNFRDSYTVARDWDAEFLVKDEKGTVAPDREGKYRWGGGVPYVICPQRAYERHVLRDMPRLASLGFRGLGYFDVVTILLAPECRDPRHPLSFADSARYWGLSAGLAQRTFGGFASEGAVDHFIGSLDSVLYASFDSDEGIRARHDEGRGLAKRHVPIFQLVYSGIVVQNPFTHTVNFTAQPRASQLKLLEYGGRPTFYFYSKFVSNGTDWMGKHDLRCGTDEELRWSVGKIKEGYDLYRRIRHLQYMRMERHEKLSDGVFRTDWSDGTFVIVNYTDHDFRHANLTAGSRDFIFGSNPPR